MADKLKELCKWKSAEYTRRKEALGEIVRESRFVCGKCGRAANRKKWLCKPHRLDDDD